MKKLLYTLLLSTLIPMTANAGYLMRDTKITEIANTNNNKDTFTIWTIGGRGPCLDQSITFTLEDSGSPEVFNRAYSAALMAFAADYKVTVYNYENDDCRQASFIHLKK